MPGQLFAGVAFLAVLPIAIWVAWSDMKFMKIPNKAVLALAAVYVVLAPFLLPWGVALWGLALMGIVLTITFVMSTAGLIGAGDAKYAAAMAPFFVGADAGFLLTAAGACILAAFLIHRALRALPAFRRLTPDWLSWTHAKFPFGLPMSGTLLFYLSAPFLTKWLGSIPETIVRG
jgi:prepilin peptidase CpaA